MTPPALPPLEIPPEVVEIARRLEEAGHQAWCVGGALRDAILRHPHADFDLATSATPDEVQRLFRRTVPVGVRFGTVGVLDASKRMHEVTTFRRDVETDGRHAVVQYGVSLDDDLARRDFTINALAYHPLRGEWRDPFGGAADLERGVVRAVGVAGERFREDYLRILRALRFAARFGFAIEPATWDAARAAAPGLRGLSAERVRDEWFKGLLTARALDELVRLWRASGAADVWLPELGDAVPRLGLAERDPVLLTVMLTSSPVDVLRRLKASGAEIARAQAIVTSPTEPAGRGEPSVRRWLAAAGPAADDVMRLHDWSTGASPWWQAPVAAIRARGDAIRREQLAVSGSDLLAAGVPAGPALGTVLGMLLDRVLDDPALNTHETLLALAAEQR
jgi:tRNA nucleotidyltransferase (CCA-adding enzyme)